MKTRKEHSALSQPWVVGLIVLGVVISIASIIWTLNKALDVQQDTGSPAMSEANEEKLYRSERFGVEIKYPATWLIYGNENETSNPDLLEVRYFVPNYDARKSFEEQPVLSLAVWNNNPESSFDAPRRYLKKLYPSETWEEVAINGYRGTKITKPNDTGATYVFARGNKLYVLEATDQVFLDTVLLAFGFVK